MYQDLNTYELLVVGITLHGFFLAGLMAIGQLIANYKSTKNILFFGLFLDFAFFELHTLLYHAQLLDHYILLNSLLILAMYSLGPLFYLLVRFVLLGSFTLKAVHLSHFIPVSLAFISTMLALVYFPAKNTKIMSGFFYNPAHMYITSGGSISFLCYLVSIWKNIQAELIWKTDVIKKEPVAQVVLLFFIIFSVAQISDILAVISNKAIFITFSSVLISLTIIFLFLISFKYPDFYQTAQRAVQKQRAKRSYLQGMNLDQIEAKLKTLMTKNEMFLDENLSLPQLAECLGISRHQLSQFLNTRLNKNFKTFVNEHRIAKAKDLLIQDKDAKVLAIALDVGFKSKSTFNAVFLKVTGKTPSDYRKSN
ncbi:MAG: helix-turn-helix domain-containing protein [Desulfobacterales bacterium]|nr:helix-turn-helix domain-containing protein [Desulfobacterales bacterium]